MKLLTNWALSSAAHEHDLGRPVGVVSKALGAWRREYEAGTVYWTLAHGATIVRPGDRYLRQPMDRIYRSGKLNELTRDETYRVGELLRGGTIVDLRTRNRVESEPDPDFPEVKRVWFPLTPTAYIPYGELVTKHKDAIREILTLMAEPGPVLIHCTEGKDRTGIIIALAMIAGGYTNDEAHEEFRRSPGTNDRDWANLIATIEWEAHGGTVRQWLLARAAIGLGLDPGVTRKLSDKCIMGQTERNPNAKHRETQPEGLKRSSV